MKKNQCQSKINRHNADMLQNVLKHCIVISNIQFIMSKRLFLFAGYDKDGIIDDALIYYVQTLSHYGDVIVCMDCDCKKSETEKIKPFAIHIIAKRHGEYDFGSYKRAFQYALNNNLLKNYVFLYLVNDSVFGPMYSMDNTIKKIEKNPSDAAGIIISKHKTHRFMESWFVRLNRKIFLSSWFHEFILNVQPEEYKYIITVKYEHGLSNLIKNNDCSWDGVYNVRGRFTYNNPKHLFKHGCPFVKKLSFTRHNGACGAQIKYVLNHTDTNVQKAIIKTANRLYGKEYMDNFLTNNPIKIFMRNIKYLLKKHRK